MSCRSEESVTAWRFMVLESDEAEEADWLAVLAQMPLRIAAVYSSAGRSIHALVRVDAASKEEWDSMARLIKPVAIRLGADKGCITAVRLTRLPGCYRGEDGPPPITAPVPRPAQDAPLEFDAHGDPILTPTLVEKPPCPWTGGILQELIYLNPNPDDEPIFNRKTREQIHAEWLAKLNAQPSENM